MSRDSQTDADRTGANCAQYTKAAQSTDIPFVGPGSLADQTKDGGWNEKDEPVGGEPADIPTAGSR